MSPIVAILFSLGNLKGVSSRMLTLRQADVTTSHSTRLSKYDSLVAGYQGERLFVLTGCSQDALTSPPLKAAIQGLNGYNWAYCKKAFSAGVTLIYPVLLFPRRRVPG